MLYCVWADGLLLVIPWKHIDQSLVYSLHGLLNFEIGGLD